MILYVSGMYFTHEEIMPDIYRIHNTNRGPELYSNYIKGPKGIYVQILLISPPQDQRASEHGELGSKRLKWLSGQRLGEAVSKLICGWHKLNI